MSPTIRLQAWGRIEGTLRISRRLGTNEIIALTSNASDSGFAPDDMRELEVKTDNEGHFEMPFVPPGRRRLSRIVLIGKGTTREYRWLGETVIEPGETKLLNLGGSGQRIIGKLKFENSEPDVNWQTMNVYISTRLSQVPPKQIVERRLYPLIVSADGTFTCDDVPPGTYDLYGQEIIDPMDYMKFGFPTYRWHRKFAEVIGTSIDEPIDLGTIELAIVWLPD